MAMGYKFENICYMQGIRRKTNIKKMKTEDNLFFND